VHFGGYSTWQGRILLKEQHFLHDLVGTIWNLILPYNLYSIVESFGIANGFGKKWCLTSSYNTMLLPWICGGSSFSAC